MIFFTGVHELTHAKHIDYAFISINRLLTPRERKSDFEVRAWIMDSGAFSQIFNHGDHKLSPSEYAKQIKRWSRCGILIRAVAQDYMCEPFILEKTGRTVLEHQSMTLSRYKALINANDSEVVILPVLQGYDPEDYARHVRDYGALLKENAWVGVGSVCKRNADPCAIYDVLDAILEVRPDLRLHGFGIKKTSLQDDRIRSRLFSADSMAWSFNARMSGRNSSDINEALSFKKRIETMPIQTAFQI